MSVSESAARSWPGSDRIRSVETRLQRATGLGVQPLLLAVDGAASLTAQLTVRLQWHVFLALVVVVGLLFTGAGLYRSRLTLSVLDDLTGLMGRTIGGGAAVAAGLLLLGQDEGQRALRTALLLAVYVVIFRAAAYRLVRRLRAVGVVQHSTMILGAGRVGGQLATLLTEHPEFGLRPVGFLDRDPLLAAHDLPVPLLGGLEDLAAALVGWRVRSVIVAFSGERGADLVDVLRTCDRLHCEIFFVPRLYELHHTSRDMDQVWGVPLIRLRRAAFRSPAWRIKRVLDLVVALLLLILLSPVMAAAALAVRLSSGPGVLFRQERVGLDGRQFAVLKFRSMGAESALESAAQIWGVGEGRRIGRVGRALRATSLDELPQLINVVRGEMSLVGPRPERPHFVSEFTEQFPRYPARHRVPCGLTGWAQVHGLRGDTSIEDRARFDNYYVQNWSLWLDVKILARTVLAVARFEGA